jgi:hypothetical protein
MEQFPGNLQNDYTKKHLPNATASLVLGIVSIAGSCCVIPGIACGIISIVLAKKDAELYRNNSDIYSSRSYSASNAGMICSVVGLFFSGTFLILEAFNIVSTSHFGRLFHH